MQEIEALRGRDLLLKENLRAGTRLRVLEHGRRHGPDQRAQELKERFAVRRSVVAGRLRPAQAGAELRELAFDDMLQHGAVQPFLAAEMVGDRREVRLRLAGQGAGGRGLEPVPAEKEQAGFKEPLPGVVVFGLRLATRHVRPRDVVIHSYE
ncbi:hypothetical protein DSECCO2_617010 [anaerobic digester metagenome]